MPPRFHIPSAVRRHGFNPNPPFAPPCAKIPPYPYARLCPIHLPKHSQPNRRNTIRPNAPFSLRPRPLALNPAAANTRRPQTRLVHTPVSAQSAYPDIPNPTAPMRYALMPLCPLALKSRLVHTPASAHLPALEVRPLSHSQPNRRNAIRPNAPISLRPRPFALNPIACKRPPLRPPPISLKIRRRKA